MNRDTTIAMERTYYHPLNNPTNPSFVASKMVVYSADGSGHNNLTIGDVVDWDLPADDGSDNQTAVSLAAECVYIQGTDTAGHDGCQSNLNRFGAEAMVGWYTNTEYNLDSCANTESYHGALGLITRLEDEFVSLLDENDTTGEPPAVRWWDTLATPGFYGDAGHDTVDQAIMMTFRHDFNLAASDTLTFWTVFVSVHDGTVSDLESSIANAKKWAFEDVRGCSFSCCQGTMVGDVDCQADPSIPDVGDMQRLIDFLFINMADLCCVDEADVDLSGQGNPPADTVDVDVGDMQLLIDHLFIDMLPLDPCP